MDTSGFALQPREGRRWALRRGSSLLRDIVAAISLVLILGGALGGCASARSYEPIPVVRDWYRIPSDFRIVGYFPSWSGDPDQVQYRALTHINYAFVNPTAEGGYRPVAEPKKLELLVTYAHAFGVKVLASLGGWNDGKTDAFATIAADPGLTATFVDSTIALVDSYNLDGIDVDWEFPAADAADDFARFVHALAERLHSSGRLLTVAVSANGFHGCNYPDSVIADADFLNIMAYDDGYGQTGVNHSSYEFAASAMDYWLIARNVPAAKAVLGVPFYGRSLENRHARTFKSIYSKDRDAPGKDVSAEYGYNGFATIRAKTLGLARSRGGGIMIWQIAQDAQGENSLLNAIFDAVKEPWKQ